MIQIKTPQTVEIGDKTRNMLYLIVLQVKMYEVFALLYAPRNSLQPLIRQIKRFDVVVARLPLSSARKEQHHNKKED